MKKILILFAVAFTAQQASAQIPEDAIRMSWTTPSGTARNQAIGGAAGSLGGDITSTFVNPAGLGFYKTSEFVFSPGISLLNGKGSFRGTDASAESASKFNFGTTGFVLGTSSPNPNTRWKYRAFSLAINKIANFNSRTYYEGQNDFSSFSESYAEEFAQSGLPIDVVLYTAPLSFPTKLANYTFLIDTATINGGTEVVGLPLRDALINGTTANLFQQKDIRTSGGITEIAIGYAANMEDKLFLGGSIGIPIVNYERTAVFTESDAANSINNFNYASYEENYSAKGAGFNAKLGLIYKPTSEFRAGLAIHTPTLYGLREITTGRMEADLENYLSDGQVSVATADSIYTQFGADIPEYRYDLVAPWKFLVSGSYMINAVEDVTKQKGFITADIEYVTHASSKFNSSDPSEDDEYYDGVNDAVKLSYKGAFNFRVGGEMKFNTFMTRLGFSYYGSPYQEKDFKARRMNVSGGVGYRNSGIFLDLTYVQGLNRDVDFPYRLTDKANTYADTKNNTGNVVLTFGVKF